MIRGPGAGKDSLEGNLDPVRAVVEVVAQFIHGLLKEIRVQEQPELFSGLREKVVKNHYLEARRPSSLAISRQAPMTCTA
jgi:hypothetical protein